MLVRSVQRLPVVPRSRPLWSFVVVLVLARSLVGENLAPQQEQGREQGKPQDSSLDPHH
jgi:hypothetical protein